MKQGRWREELDFPGDCAASGYTPHLVVFDPTSNPKLTQLQEAFSAEGGESHIGRGAWQHVEQVAGTTMAKFLERYMRNPLDDLLSNAPAELPELRLAMESDRVVFRLGDVEYVVPRDPRPDFGDDEPRAIPEDAPDFLPGL